MENLFWIAKCYEIVKILGLTQRPTQCYNFQFILRKLNRDQKHRNHNWIAYIKGQNILRVLLCRGRVSVRGGGGDLLVKTYWNCWSIFFNIYKLRNLSALVQNDFVITRSFTGLKTGWGFWFGTLIDTSMDVTTWYCNKIFRFTNANPSGTFLRWIACK